MSESTFTAPVKVCPSCGAQAQTVDSKCPNCGKKYKQKNRTWLKVLLGLLVLSLVLIGGCVALLGNAAEEVSEELNAQQEENAISEATFDSLQIGATRADVDAAVAPATPQDAQEFEQEGVLDEENIQSSCIYFNKSGGSFGDIYQLCFDGDSLTSKNSY